MIYSPGWFPLIAVLQKCPLFPVLCDLFTWLIPTHHCFTEVSTISCTVWFIYLADRCFTEVSAISCTVWFTYLGDSHWSLFYRSFSYFLYYVIYSPGWFSLIAVLQKFQLFPVLCDLFTWLILTDRCFTEVSAISCTMWFIHLVDSHWSLFYGVSAISCTMWFIYLVDSHWSLFYRSVRYFLYYVIYSPGWFALITVLQKCSLFPVLCDLFTWLILTDRCFTEVSAISCTMWFIHLADSDWSVFYRSVRYFMYCVIYSPGWFPLIAVLQKCPLFPVLCDLFTWLITVLQKYPLFPVLCDLFPWLIRTDRCFTEVSAISCTMWFIHLAESHWSLFYRSAH